MTDIARQLYEHLQRLCKGRINAMTIRLICARYGFNRRAVELALEELRDKGIPVCSETSRAPRGIYLAQNVAEFEPFFSQIQGRIQKMSHRCKLMRQTLERMSTEAGSPVTFTNQLEKQVS